MIQGWPTTTPRTADLLTRNYVNSSIQLWYHILSPKLTSTPAENKKNFWQDRNANLGEGTGSTLVRCISTLIFYYQWLKCTNMFFRFLLVGIWGSPSPRLYLIQLWSLGAVAPFFTAKLWPGLYGRLGKEGGDQGESSYVPNSELSQNYFLKEHPNHLQIKTTVSCWLHLQFLQKTILYGYKWAQLKNPVESSHKAVHHQTAVRSQFATSMALRLGEACLAETWVRAIDSPDLRFWACGPSASLSPRHDGKAGANN
jgi:hypothetical protein